MNICREVTARYMRNNYCLSDCSALCGISLQIFMKENSRWNKGSCQRRSELFLLSPMLFFISSVWERNSSDCWFPSLQFMEDVSHRRGDVCWFCLKAIKLFSFCFLRRQCLVNVVNVVVCKDLESYKGPNQWSYKLCSWGENSEY